MKPAKRRGWLVALAALGLGGALLLAAVPALWPAEPLRERIVYTTFRPPNTDIFLFDTPASAPRRLTADPALDYNPVFSPDGQWVVFCSERRGNPDLYAL